jgi:hypothetical protein
MILESRFSREQLHHIIEEAMIYMCACPAQLAQELFRLREMFEYQANCLSDSSTLMANVHHKIAESTRIAHAELERCLQEVLQLEGWDTQTLTMPAGLRQLREKILDQES